MEPIPNEHIARAVARSLLNIVGPDSDERFQHTFVNTVIPVRWAFRRLCGSEVHSS